LKKKLAKKKKKIGKKNNIIDFQMTLGMQAFTIRRGIIKIMFMLFLLLGWRLRKSAQFDINPIYGQLRDLDMGFSII